MKKLLIILIIIACFFVAFTQIRQPKSIIKVMKPIELQIEISEETWPYGKWIYTLYKDKTWDKIKTK